MPTAKQVPIEDPSSLQFSGSVEKFNPMSLAYLIPFGKFSNPEEEGIGPYMPKNRWNARCLLNTRSTCTNAQKNLKKQMAINENDQILEFEAYAAAGVSLRGEVTDDPPSAKFPKCSTTFSLGTDGVDSDLLKQDDNNHFLRICPLDSDILKKAIQKIDGSGDVGNMSSKNTHNLLCDFVQKLGKRLPDPKDFKQCIDFAEKYLLEPLDSSIQLFGVEKMKSIISGDANTSDNVDKNLIFVRQFIQANTSRAFSIALFFLAGQHRLVFFAELLSGINKTHDEAYEKFFKSPHHLDSDVRVNFVLPTLGQLVHPEIDKKMRNLSTECQLVSDYAHPCCKLILLRGILNEIKRHRISRLGGDGAVFGGWDNGSFVTELMKDIASCVRSYHYFEHFTEHPDRVDIDRSETLRSPDLLSQIVLDLIQDGTPDGTESGLFFAFKSRFGPLSQLKHLMELHKFSPDYTDKSGGGKTIHLNLLDISFLQIVSLIFTSEDAFNEFQKIISYPPAEEQNPGEPTFENFANFMYSLFFSAYGIFHHFREKSTSVEDRVNETVRHFVAFTQAAVHNGLDMKDDNLVLTLYYKQRYKNYYSEKEGEDLQQKIETMKEVKKNVDYVDKLGGNLFAAVHYILHSCKRENKWTEYSLQDFIQKGCHFQPYNREDPRFQDPQDRRFLYAPNIFLRSLATQYLSATASRVRDMMSSKRNRALKDEVKFREKLAVTKAQKISQNVRDLKSILEDLRSNQSEESFPQGPFDILSRYYTLHLLCLDTSEADNDIGLNMDFLDSTQPHCSLCSGNYNEILLMVGHPLISCSVPNCESNAHGECFDTKRQEYTSVMTNSQGILCLDHLNEYLSSYCCANSKEAICGLGCTNNTPFAPNQTKLQCVKCHLFAHESCYNNESKMCVLCDANASRARGI